MKNNHLSRFKIFVVLMVISVSSGLAARADSINGWDGPYILMQADGTVRMISVTEDNLLCDNVFAHPADVKDFTVVSHAGQYRFDVALQPVQRPKWKHKQPQELFVLSDPHGRMDCMVSLLQTNGVIDENLTWSYGKNHLVIIGDVFDRGDDVTQILWLIYKLEQEAFAKGGMVSFQLGNHEPMVLNNDMRYANEKYKALADMLRLDYSDLFAKNTVLGQWLATRNTIQVIGNDLYVHAGLSKTFYDLDIDIPTVNSEISRGIYFSKEQRKADSALMEFLYGSKGPIWYRGMVRDEEKYDPLESQDLEALLKRYKVSRIIIGHSIFPDITEFYKGRVIDVNVNNEKNRDEGRGRGLLIKKGKTYIVGDHGVMNQL